MTATRKKIAIAVAGGVLVVVGVVGVINLARITVIAVAGLLAAGLLIFFVFKVWAKRKTKTIFGFYVAANDVLSDSDGSRYHFEVADVIKNGEKVVRSMPDAPPLTRFALGSLYYSTGNHSAAVEHLALAAEEEVLKESPHVLPSRALRRYVKRLRKIERHPRIYRKINTAMLSLEEMHRERGARLLAVSQQQLKRMVENQMSEPTNTPRRDLPISSVRSLKSITAPPTISEVLNDVYQEEPTAS